jgi:hypothetical protein
VILIFLFLTYLAHNKEFLKYQYQKEAGRIDRAASDGAGANDSF